MDYLISKCSPCSSVIIPHYEDVEHLTLCLNALAAQTIQTHFEVIVVDDGSSMRSQTAIHSMETGDWPFSFIWIAQDHKLQAAARNTGARSAKSELLVFLQSDVIPEPQWLQTHVDFHGKHTDHKVASMGPYSFTEEILADRFCRWLEISGNQANFDSLKDGQPVDCFHCYSGNLAVKRKWFARFGFREEFHDYGWEDVCLGYEMIRSGGQVYFLKNARAWHHHYMRPDVFFSRRMISIGRSAVTLESLHPELNIIPKGMRYIYEQLKGNDFVIWILRYIFLEWSWISESKKWFLKGVVQARCDCLKG